MKNSVLILVFFLLSPIRGVYNSNNTKRQEGKTVSIIGRWQKDSNELSSAWLENYQFYADGKFIYNFDEYDAMKRVISLKGSYRLEGQLIYFKINYRIEQIGGYVSRTASGTDMHGWAFIGHKKEIEVFQTDSVPEEYAILKTCTNIDSSQCIQIDNEKFYKISDNPDAEWK